MYLPLYLAGLSKEVDGMTEPTVFIVDDDAAVLDSIAELVMSVGLRAATGEFI